MTLLSYHRKHFFDWDSLPEAKMSTLNIWCKKIFQTYFFQWKRTCFEKLWIPLCIIRWLQLSFITRDDTKRVTVFQRPVLPLNSVIIPSSDEKFAMQCIPHQSNILQSFAVVSNNIAICLGPLYTQPPQSSSKTYVFVE